VTNVLGERFFVGKIQNIVGISIWEAEFGQDSKESKKQESKKAREREIRVREKERDKRQRERRESNWNSEMKSSKKQTGFLDLELALSKHNSKKDLSKSYSINAWEQPKTFEA
jgi:hypothetical protein